MRPPSDETDAEPASIAFGIAAVDDHLDGVDVSFPATEEELVEAMGDVEVPYDARGHTVRLGDVIEACDAERFADEQALMNELHPVFEHHRQHAGSLTERLKRILPF